MTAATMPAQPKPRPRLDAKGVFNLFKDAAKEWSEDKVPRLGAALAYYTTFSLAPLLILIIAIAGLTLGQREAAQEAVVGQLRGLVGQEGAGVIETAIENSSKPAAGIIASIVSVITLLFGALGAFGQLQDALNTIWEVKPKPGRGILGVIKDRLLSLSMVLVIGFFLVVSLVASAGLTALGTFLSSVVPGPEIVMEIVNFIISLVVISVLFAIMFKYLPDAKIAWRDVVVGAVATALLFTIGKTLIGLYLGNAAVTTTYGAAGSLVVLLLWMYYSAQIFLFGAELTQVYANRFGTRVEPAENAVAVTEADRANEGLPRKEGSVSAGAAAGAAAPAGATLASTDQALAIVGPYEAIPGAEDIVVMEPVHPQLEQRDYVVALLTFAAGLGAGAMVALGGSRSEDPPPKDNVRRADRIRRSNGKRR
jgi:membrane protein